MKREKRLSKVISSIEEQIKIHEDKLAAAQESEDEDLEVYYTKEVEALKKRVDNRKSKLNRKDI